MRAMLSECCHVSSTSGPTLRLPFMLAVWGSIALPAVAPVFAQSKDYVIGAQDVLIITVWEHRGSHRQVQRRKAMGRSGSR